MPLRFARSLPAAPYRRARELGERYGPDIRIADQYRLDYDEYDGYAITDAQLVTDSRLTWDAMLRREALYSEDVWHELQPAGFDFSCSCDALPDRLHSHSISDWFVDAYCATFPTEDRARIMEYAMAGLDRPISGQSWTLTAGASGTALTPRGGRRSQPGKGSWRSNRRKNLDILYQDDYLLVCVKPAGVASTQLPECLRQELGLDAPLRTVHRLDQPVGGLMVLAKRKHTAADLSQQIREGTFQKEYQAVVHGCPEKASGTYRDLLGRNKQTRTTFVAPVPGKDIQEAVLDYAVTGKAKDMSRLSIRLHTGRTHQIRVQFSSREMPLVGDQRYGRGEDCPIALWSCRLAFTHPKTGRPMEFTREPPEIYPWTEV